MNILYVNSLEASNKELARQLASCQAALADTEALEIGTGERLAKVEKQLAAAHAARVSAQASGIRLLDQLTEAKEECDTLRRIHAENIAILERKTAQAVAACKLKDEALKHIALIDLGRDTLPTDFCMNVLSVRKALAIQPDDAALKAWLGEPVAWRTFDGEGGYDFRSYDDNEDYRSKWDARNPNHKSWVELLYSPKGLK